MPLRSRFKEDTAMELVGRRVRFRLPHGVPTTEVIKQATLTTQDIILYTESGKEIHFSGADVILAEFPKDLVKSSMASAT